MDKIMNEHEDMNQQHDSSEHFDDMKMVQDDFEIQEKQDNYIDDNSFSFEVETGKSPPSLPPLSLSPTESSPSTVVKAEDLTIAETTSMEDIAL